MDPSINVSLDSSTNKVPLTKVSVTNTPSLNVPSANTGTPNVIKKHIIRRITHLDLEKLQQAGLDRKIAEALSKHKTEQKNKVLKKGTDDLKAITNTDAYTKEIGSTVSKPSNIHEGAAVKKPESTFKGKPPPKITITGPDALSEIEKQKLASLDPHQRLVHVKNLLNKKILQKSDTEIIDKAKINQHLKPPPTLSESPHDKFVKKQEQESPSTKTLYCVLKDPSEGILEPTNKHKKVTATTNLDCALTPTSIKRTTTKTPQKLPQDIARKLDFQIETNSGPAHPVKQQYMKCLNKNVSEVPKTLVKPVEIHDRYTILPANATKSESLKQPYYLVNTTTKGTTFQTEYIKQQKNIYKNTIPKASIKTSSSKQQKLSETNLDFPQVSPLKVSFPTVNVAKETPLPTIDSFKKPFSMGSTPYYDTQQKTGDKPDFIITNYGTSLFNDELTTSLATPNIVNNAPTTSTLTNSLIVLENKILSQDEMIDLTELRLPTTTPRFINPHRPIPELVIKQERTDECPETGNSNPAAIIKPKQLQRQNKDKVSTDRLTTSNKRKKRIIINTQKLKFTPEQLAELAKKMKEKASSSLPVTREINQSNQVQNVRILSTNAASAQLPTKTMTLVPHNAKNIAETEKEISDKFIIKNKPIYDYVQDHNYRYKQTEQILQSTGGATSSVVNATPIDPTNQSYFQYSYDESQKSLNHTNCLEPPENSESTKQDNISAVEIVDEPIENEDCFSAVDFILALGNTNTITSDKTLELSPEEFNLNASCSINLSAICKEPCNTPGLKSLTSQKTSTPKISTTDSNNSLKNEMKSAIAVESSKNSHAVRANDSPIKGVSDQNNFNTIETVMSANMNESKLDLVDMDIETSLGSAVTEATTKKPEYVLANKATAEKKHCSSEFTENSNSDCNSYKMKNFEASIKSNAMKSDLKTTKATPIDNEMMSSHKDITKFPQEIAKKHWSSEFVENLNSDCNSHKIKTSEASLKTTTEQPTGNEMTSSNKDITKLPQEIAKKHCSSEFKENLNSDCNSQKVKTFEASLKSNATKSDLRTTTEKPSDNETTSSNKDISKLPKEIAKKHCSSNFIENLNSDYNSQKVKTFEASLKSNATKSDLKSIIAKPTDNEMTSSNKDITKSHQEIARKHCSSEFMENLNSDCNSHKVKHFEASLISNAKNIDLKTTTENPTDNEISSTDKDITKLPQEIPSSKNSAVSSNTIVTTKRISRFKKGKINLVQRNKAGQSLNKPLTEDKNILVNKSSLYKESENKVAETQDELHKKTEKNLIELYNNMFTFPNQANETPQQAESIKSSNEKEGTLKETKLAETRTYPPVEITDNKLLIPRSIAYTEVDESVVINNLPETRTSTPENQTISEDKSPQTSVLTKDIQTTSIDSSNMPQHHTDTSEITPKKLTTTKAAEPSNKNKDDITITQQKHFESQENSEKCPEVKGIKILLNQLKGGDNENEPESSINCKATLEVPLEIKEHKAKTKRCSRRSASKTPTETTPSPTLRMVRRHSTRTLISDDDLEFLPENVEIKFKLSNEKIDSQIGKPDRRQSLYSKPFELEFFNTPSSSRAKGNRFYSQTLETNASITFDNLKSEQGLPKYIKPLGKEESCDTNTTQESCPIKQYKNKCKNTIDIKETENSHNIINADNDNRDYDCVMRDCEESNEFLGFEDNPESGNIKNVQHDIKETDHTTKTKHGTLKNWLTTGKAISPTLEQQSRKRLRVEDELTELSSSSPVICDSKKENLLKRRWDLCSPSYDETDITDDTSPADDDEEINEKISVKKKCKRGIKNVMDSNKEIIDSKKTKLEASIDQSFAKPRNAKLKNSITDSDCYKEKSGISQKSPISGKKSEIIEKNAKKDKKVPRSEPDSHEEMHTKAQRLQLNAEKFVTNSHLQECEESRYCKSKDKEGNIKKTNNSSELYKASDADKAVVETDTNIDKSSSNSQRGMKSNNRKHGKKAEDLDNNLDVEGAKNKRRFQPKSVDDEEENLLHILQQPDIADTKPSDNKIKNETSRVEDEDTDAPGLLEKVDSENCIIVKPEQETSFITPQNVTAKRKRGRPKKIAISDSSEDEVHSTSSPLTTPRGRKSKQTLESNFNSRLLLITNRAQLDTDEKLTETQPEPGPIQCGLCLNHTQPGKWLLHLSEHYGVGWKVGEEKLHIENRSAVLNSILRYMKVTGCNEIKCRMCGKGYRSALGILSHIESCGAEVIRVVCEFCKREYVKTSLIVHLRNCYSRNRIENQSSDKNEGETNGGKEEIFGNSGRLKRTSTIKAENKLKVLGEELEKLKDDEKQLGDPKQRIRYVELKAERFSAKWCKDIKELGKASCPKSRCKFTSNDINELSRHLKECRLIRSGYSCNFCRRIFQSEKEAIEHVIKRHQNCGSEPNDSDCDLKSADENSSDEYLSEGVDENELTDDGTVEDDVEYVKANDKKCNKRQTSRKAVFDGRHLNLDKEVLRKWKDFLKSNYASEPLYKEFASNYSIVRHQKFNRYLPTQTVSMKYNFGSSNTLISAVGVPQKNIEWTEMKRYESSSNKMNTYFFLGAPVKLCCWLPLPSHVNEQYLAVVYRADMFKFIKLTNPKQHPSIVLILKVTRNNQAPELNIHYGFVVNDGPIHHLSFLPSGGYYEASNRLGVVAVATVTSCINIYSLPLNVELSSTQDKCSTKNNITLIDVKPSFVLNLDMFYQKDVQQQHTLLNTQCLQVYWSEYSDHQHIFAGFSNGFIGIWEIVNDPQQNLNHFVVEGVINYVPLNYFYIGEKCAKFAVHYDTSGPRWLAVSSVYRKLIIYDIKNLSQPIIMKEDFHKNLSLDMDWCPVWETVLYSYCDSLQSYGRALTAVNPNNIMFPHTRVDVMSCGITQVHYTPVTNVCVTALSNGDIVFLNTRELHYECPLDKKFGERRLLYGMDVKQLNGEPLLRLGKGNKNDDIPSGWIMNDANYKEKYGLIFEPLLKIKESHRKNYVDDNRAPPVNMLPLMRINTLRCNLNENSKDLIAVGYENGFLRLVIFNKRPFVCNKKLNGGIEETES